jgi:hypothetical protein
MVSLTNLQVGVQWLEGPPSGGRREGNPTQRRHRTERRGGQNTGQCRVSSRCNTGTRRCQRQGTRYGTLTKPRYIRASQRSGRAGKAHVVLVPYRNETKFKSQKLCPLFSENPPSVDSSSTFSRGAKASRKTVAGLSSSNGLGKGTKSTESRGKTSSGVGSGKEVFVRTDCATRAVTTLYTSLFRARKPPRTWPMPQNYARYCFK